MPLKPGRVGSPLTPSTISMAFSEVLPFTLEDQGDRARGLTDASGSDVPGFHAGQDSQGLDLRDANSPFRPGS